MFALTDIQTLWCVISGLLGLVTGFILAKFV
jgi:hypothetical protein